MSSVRNQVINKNAVAYFGFLFISLMWSPTFFKMGDDILLIGEILIVMAIPFVIIVALRRRINIPKEVFFFFFPFLVTFLGVSRSVLLSGSVDVFSWLLVAKQLEFVSLMFLGLFGAKAFRSELKTDSKKIFLTLFTITIVLYSVFILLDGIENLGRIHRASIPIKPGVATAISGFFCSVTIFIGVSILSFRRLLVFGLSVTLVGAAALVLTLSRTAIMACLLVIIVNVFLTHFLKGKLRHTLLLLILLIVVIGVMNFVLSSIGWTYDGFSSISIGGFTHLVARSSSFSKRFDVILRSAVDSIDEYGLRQLLFGVQGMSVRIWDSQYFKLLFEVGLLGSLFFLLPFARTLIKSGLHQLKAGASPVMKIISAVVFQTVFYLLIASITGELISNAYIVMQPVYLLIGAYIGFTSGGKSVVAREHIDKCQISNVMGLSISGSEMK